MAAFWGPPVTNYPPTGASTNWNYPTQWVTSGTNILRSPAYYEIWTPPPSAREPKLKAAARRAYFAAESRKKALGPRVELPAVRPSARAHPMPMHWLSKPRRAVRRPRDRVRDACPSG
jgi:hypothetical protein